MSEAVVVGDSDDGRVEAGWRKLMFAMHHPHTSTQGVSERAVQQMALAVEALEDLEDPVAHPGARRTLRFVAALIPLRVPGTLVASLVCEVANHPALPLPEVRAILRGDVVAGQDPTPVETMREIVEYLRDGYSRDEIADGVGVSRRLVQDLAAWMGRAEAKDELLQERALSWTGNIEEFARVNGIGQKYASRLLRAAWGRG